MAEQIKWLEGFIAHSLPALTAAYGVPALLLMLLLCVDWRPFLIASAALALGFAMMVILGKRASGVLTAREKSLDAINHRLSDFVKGMPVIRACDRVEDKERELKRGLEDMDAVLKASLKREIPLLAGAGCALELGLVLALMLNAGLTMSGAMAPRTFVLATLLTVLIFLPALQQVGGSVMLRFARDAEKALSAFLSAPDLVCGEAGKTSKNNILKNKAPENNAIRFENVSFAYPGERSRQIDPAQSAGALLRSVLRRGETWGNRSARHATRAGSEGQALSGGERQRIAIARAILKNAPIVVLDEASAAIDPINAAAIQEAIGALSRGRTLIVIAHHLGAIAQAERIIVLNKGSVEAVGRHARLLEQSPIYRRLWEAHRNSLAWSLA